MTLALSRPLLCLACLLPVSAGAQPLGRLFFTPDQRMALDQQRHLNLTNQDAGILTIRGRVERSSGRRTIWLNERPLTEMDALPDSLAKRKVGETIPLGGHR